MSTVLEPSINKNRRQIWTVWCSRWLTLNRKGTWPSNNLEDSESNGKEEWSCSASLMHPVPSPGTDFVPFLEWLRWLQFWTLYIHLYLKADLSKWSKYLLNSNCLQARTKCLGMKFGIVLGTLEFKEVHYWWGCGHINQDSIHPQKHQYQTLHYFS